MKLSANFTMGGLFLKDSCVLFLLAFTRYGFLNVEQAISQNMKIISKADYF